MSMAEFDVCIIGGGTSASLPQLQRDVADELAGARP